MVNGIDSFKKWFKGCENQYVIIGGTACDILTSSEGLDFRATKDIDLVLIVEAINDAFVRKFWQYIEEANYQHINKSSNTPEFYRFTNPKSKEYPAMIELFSRKLEKMTIKPNSQVIPLPICDEVSSLSAILLDDDYYVFLKEGIIVVSGLSVLSAEYLIPFKAKAFLDLCSRRTNGEQVDLKNIKKHKNDVFRLTELIVPTKKIALPSNIHNDMYDFVNAMFNEEVDLKQLHINKSKQEILQQLIHIYLDSPLH